MSLDTRLQRIWYGPRGAAFLALRPLSWLFCLLVRLRASAFRAGLLRSVRVGRPVIVVGNITVGGTGKTPLTIWLAERLAAQGRRVGVITKGYGGRATSWPQRVQAGSDPGEVGDEAVLIAQRSQAMVFAGPDRVAAARAAIAGGADVVISDDGLQHYRLQRDCELAVVDAARLFGNGSMLPAGPLREPVGRLRRVQQVLLNLRMEAEMPRLGLAALGFRIVPSRLRSLTTGETRALDEFKGRMVHVVTGIGHPEAFIASLRALGMTVDARVLPDHAALTPADIEFGDDAAVLMTEKDAVKCRAFADGRHWAVEAEVHMDAMAVERLLDCVQRALTERSD